MNSNYKIIFNLKWWFLARHEKGYYFWARSKKRFYKIIYYIYPPGFPEELK